MSHHHQSSSPFPSCFRPPSTSRDEIIRFPPQNRPSTSAAGSTTLSTSLYQTDVGIFSVTWSRTMLSHSLHLHLHLNPIDSVSAAAAGSSPFSLSDPYCGSTWSFHLHIKPFAFWKKRGSKKIQFINQEKRGKTRRPTVRVFWDLGRAKFGSGSVSGPDPQSGFYVAVVVDGEMTLLVGDLTKEAYSKTKAKKP